MSVEEMIQDDWAQEPRVMNACLQVWQALASSAVLLDHYTFPELQALAHEPGEALVSKALLYLSNPRLKVLKPCLLYEHHGMYLELPADEVAHYSKGAEVIHPGSGRQLSESEIVLCFAPAERLNRGADS